MADALLFFGGRFGGADVEAAIDLHGIDGNDFAADALGELQSDFGFADGGWAGDEDGVFSVSVFSVVSSVGLAASSCGCL